MSVVPLLRFTVSPEDEGIRIDTFLAQVETDSFPGFCPKITEKGEG